METHNPVFLIKWPSPGILSITAVISLAFILLVVYLALYYIRMKEQNRIQNYQLFLFQVKRRGLSNFQIKILRNMSAYMKLSNPKAVISNSQIFESAMGDFVEYIKKQPDEQENITDIIRDLAVIHKKIFRSAPAANTFETLADLENSEVIYITDDDGNIFPGKVAGKTNSHIALSLFTPVKNLKIYENGKPLSLHVLRINDAEYAVKTDATGIDMAHLLIKNGGDITREKEFRHPYINMMISAYISDDASANTDNPEKTECAIVQLNEYECVVRAPLMLNFDRLYRLSFELESFRFHSMSRVISSKTVERESVYYLTLKFIEMSDSGRAVLRRYIAENI